MAGFLVAPRRAVLLVCETCAPVLTGMAADATGNPDAAIAIPCRSSDPMTVCDACGYLLDSNPKEVTH